jgi:hypothetical protein
MKQLEIHQASREINVGEMIDHQFWSVKYEKGSQRDHLTREKTASSLVKKQHRHS